MSVQQILDTRRHGMAGCDIVAFGDYRSLLILRSSHGSHIRREALDRLSGAAATMFAQLDAIGKARRTDRPLLTCGSFHTGKRIAFARTDTGDSEFVCIAGSYSTSIIEALTLAALTLRDVEASV